MRTYRIESVGFGTRNPCGVTLMRVGHQERLRLFNLLRRGESLPFGTVLVALGSGPLREIQASDIAWDKADLPEPR